MNTMENTFFQMPKSNSSVLEVDVIGKILTSVDGVMSDEAAYYATLINVVIVCTILCVFGILSNIVNMIVIRRQGFQDTVNITLFSIATADLISLTTTLWMALCYNPLFISLDLPFLPLEVEVLFGQTPHTIALSIISWLTAFVTFERCLCIAFPLKVKDIITTKRTKVVIVSIFVANIAIELSMIWVTRLEWKFDPERNKTVLGVLFIEENMYIDTIKIYVMYVVGIFTSFSIVVVCSTILVVKLYEKSKWRTSVTAKSKSGNDETIATRDRKVMKLILAVALIFIVTYIPGLIVSAWAGVYEEAHGGGALANNYFVSVSCALVFDTINSCANIFVYYNMSSKYQAQFRYLFCPVKKDLDGSV